MARLFIAAWPPDEVAVALRELARPALRGVRWSTPNQWHVTLRFLGDTDADEVRERLTARHLPAATARLGPAVDHLGPRLVMVPASGLDALAAAVRDATAGLGEPVRSPFRGHLTLARTKRGVELPLLGTPFDASFPVDEIAVVESDLTPDGAVYTTVARVRTGEPTEA